MAFSFRQVSCKVMAHSSREGEASGVSTDGRTDTIDPIRTTAHRPPPKRNTLVVPATCTRTLGGAGPSPTQKPPIPAAGHSGWSRRCPGPLSGAAPDPATRPGDATGLSKKVTWADYTRRIFLTTKIFKKRTTKWWTGFSRKRWTPHALHPQRPLGGEHGGKWPPRTVRAATDGSSPVEGCLAHPKDSPGQGDGLRGEAALGGSAQHLTAVSGTA